MERMLEGKNAIVYGAGGGIGRGLARTFAREGARLFLTGRTRAPLERVASTIEADGGVAEVAELDALDERAVHEHARDVARRAGKLDISVNLIWRGDAHGVPLLDMTPEDFFRPVTTGLTANFNTARAAARPMAEQGSGVILAITSGSSRGAAPGMGGTAPADAATEAFLRRLAAEVGPSGVRVLCLWTAGVPETFGLEDDTNRSRIGTGLTPEGVDSMLGPKTMLGHAPRLAQVADTAAFLCSDRAGGMTGTIANVTCGLVPG